MNIKNTVKRMLKIDSAKLELINYYKKFSKYSFIDGKCETKKQYEASIIRLYHTIEKGLAYDDFRAGFGETNVNLLIDTLKSYGEQFDISCTFYETALSCLYEYIRKNAECGYVNEKLFSRIKSLPGRANESGGTVLFKPLDEDELKTLNYFDFVKNRKSIRHFTGEAVDIEKVKDAIRIAQYTPSACNRQGWKTRIISDKEIVQKVLANQNGNKGFGQEIDKLLIVTADLRCFQRSRETFQAYIDGGMYAESVLNALHYKKIGSIPLSASLTKVQDENVRKIVGIHEAEVLILFIGIGNYPEICQTTKSARMTPKIEII